ncbi:hypothetical protein EV359DRAFT_63020 [Lentinula novae-zelandiae]|nr:hypothetical protein EV359DRAFT_63020 [Lentinula novae-zelandiae]
MDFDKYYNFLVLGQLLLLVKLKLVTLASTFALMLSNITSNRNCWSMIPVPAEERYNSHFAQEAFVLSAFIGYRIIQVVSVAAGAQFSKMDPRLKATCNTGESSTFGIATPMLRTLHTPTRLQACTLAQTRAQQTIPIYGNKL